MISFRIKAVLGVALACGMIIAVSLWLRPRRPAVPPPRSAPPATAEEKSSAPAPRPGRPAAPAPPAVTPDGNAAPKLAIEPAPAPAPAKTGNGPQPAATAAAPAPAPKPAPGGIAIRPGGSPEIMGSVAASILSRRTNLADPGERARIVRQLRGAAAAERQVTLEKAKRLGLPLVTDSGAILAGFEGARPLYESGDNTNAAISTATDLVRSTFPYSVDGTGYTIGQWEAEGIPRVSHLEFSGRLTINDGSSGTSFHATHVAGTLIAAGIFNPSVKGMAPSADVLAHSSVDDEAEMVALAAAVANEPGKINVSCHSYGTTAGWIANPWRWFGTFTDDGDPGNDFPDFFGRYSADSACWDGIAWNAPYYLIFKSGGNDRDDSAPPAASTWRLNDITPFSYNPASHPIADFDQLISGSVTGFGTVGQKASCKNVITVGAVVDAVAAGVRDVNEADLTAFTSFGPTDDGRIKPDIVANGQTVLSLDDDSDTDTRNNSGTSMSNASACGSALLLIDYHDDRFPLQAMHASSLKALMIHTADDRGNAGPDYRFGWGLLNTEAAAALIKDHADTPGEGRMTESGLSATTASRTLPFAWNGIDPIRVTLCWTDPPGPATLIHDDRGPRLVHDLNLKVTAPDESTQYFPYIMPWVGDWTDAMLDAPATTGVNTVDNIEQVYIAAPTMAGEYVVTVDHAGGLGMGPQEYALIVSGGNLPRGYDLWAAEEYPGQWNIAALAGFDADPDGNRLSNGLEYAFNLGAGGTASGGIFTMGNEMVGPDEFITLTYDRDTSKTDIAYEAEWTTDLQNWNTLPSVVQSTSGVIETVKASLLAAGPKSYLRVKITRL